MNDRNHKIFCRSLTVVCLIQFAMFPSGCYTEGKPDLQSLSEHELGDTTDTTGTTDTTQSGPSVHESDASESISEDDLPEPTEFTETYCSDEKTLDYEVDPDNPQSSFGWPVETQNAQVKSIRVDVKWTHMRPGDAAPYFMFGRDEEYFISMRETHDVVPFRTYTLDNIPSFEMFYGGTAYGLWTMSFTNLYATEACVTFTYFDIE